MRTSRPTEQMMYHRLSELRDLVHQGKFSQLTGDVVFNLEDVSAKDLEVLVEIVRHRLAQSRSLKEDLLTDQSLHSKVGVLQKLRSLIHHGEFERAIQHAVFRNSVHDKDLLIERARGLIFLARYQEAQLLLEKILTDAFPNLTQKGVAFQMYGHCLYELGDGRSEFYLQQAYEIGYQVQNSAGQMAALLMLSRLKAVEGDEPCARDLLARAVKLVEQSLNFRWLLGLYRSLGQIHFLLGGVRAHEEMRVSERIAQSLGDRHFLRRSMIERAIMEKVTFGTDIEENLGDQDWISDSVATEDLKDWIRIAREPQSVSIGDSKTLRLFAERMLARESKGEPTHESASTRTFAPAWILDLSNGFLIDFIHQSAQKVATDSPALKLVAVISQSCGGLSTEDAFQKTWGLKYLGDRHTNTVKSTLRRLKATFPILEIKRHRDGLKLVFQGFVIHP